MTGAARWRRSRRLKLQSPHQVFLILRGKIFFCFYYFVSREFSWTGVDRRKRGERDITSSIVFFSSITLWLGERKKERPCRKGNGLHWPSLMSLLMLFHINIYILVMGLLFVWPKNVLLWLPNFDIWISWARLHLFGPKGFSDSFVLLFDLHDGSQEPGHEGHRCVLDCEIQSISPTIHLLHAILYGSDSHDRRVAWVVSPSSQFTAVHLTFSFAFLTDLSWQRFFSQGQILFINSSKIKCCPMSWSRLDTWIYFIKINIPGSQALDGQKFKCTLHWTGFFLRRLA